MSSASSPVRLWWCYWPARTLSARTLEALQLVTVTRALREGRGLIAERQGARPNEPREGSSTRVSASQNTSARRRLDLALGATVADELVLAEEVRARLRLTTAGYEPSGWAGVRISIT
jgi:hypothetical protein